MRTKGPITPFASLLVGLMLLAPLATVAGNQPVTEVPLAAPLVLPASGNEHFDSNEAPQFYPESPSKRPPIPPMPVTGSWFFDPPPPDGVPVSPLRRPEWGDPRVPAPKPQQRRSAAPDAGLMTYTQVDVLVVVYTQTADGTFADTEGLLVEIDEAEAFYARNSHMKLDLAIDVVWIDEYKEIDEFWELWTDAYWLPFWDTDGDGRSVTQDLYDKGISDDQYDGVVVYYAWGDGPYGAALGGGAYGVDVGFMGQTGYAAIPLAWSLVTQDWFFIHEFHHELDSMYYYSGYPAYPHADIPHPMPGDFGENYDFNAAIMRGWPLDDWAGLAAPWGTPAYAMDDDGDGLPGSTTGLLVTESSIGSDPLLPDGDGDGLDDLGEAVAGIFGPSDPGDADSDADALWDGDDPYPIYPVNRQARPGNVTLDGVLSEGEGWREFGHHWWQMNSGVPFSATIYSTWDDDYLYLGLRVSHFAYFRFYMDADNDGWFHGRDNYQLGFDPSYSYPTTYDPSVRVYDASLQTLCANPGGPWPMWDDDSNYPFGRLVLPGDILHYAQSDGGTGHVAELAIPANADTGLLPQAGEVVGLRITLDHIDRNPFTSASMFETESFVDLGLAGGLNGTDDLFESATLSPLWTWVDPLGDCTYSLTDQPGSLRIAAADGGHDLYLNTDAPRLLQPATGDFAAETQVTLEPLHGYQGAGLVVWADANNYVRLERAGGPDQRVFLWYRNGGVYDAGGEAEVSAAMTHLRFERSGNSFTGSYSHDGVSWTPVGTVSIGAGPTVMVGLDVINEWQDNPIHADFAHFRVIPGFDVDPPGGTITIEGGQPFTRVPRVGLDLTATDPSGAFRMRLDDGRQLWFPRSYSSMWPCLLPVGEGTKTVSVRFEDNFGATSSPISSVIGLDQTPPEATFSLGQNDVTHQVTTTVQAEASDGFSGLSTMMYSNEWGWEVEDLNHDLGWWVSDPDASGSRAWVARERDETPGLMVYGPGTYDLPPGRSYRAIFRLKVPDNWVPCSVVTLDVFDRDQEGEDRILGSRGVGADEFYQPNVYQEFAVDFDYTEAGVQGLEFRVHYADRVDVYADTVLLFSAPQPYEETSTWRLAPGDGLHTVWGRFEDAADNAFQTEATVLLDTTPDSHSLGLSPAWNLISWPLEPLPDGEMVLDEIEQQGGTALHIHRWQSKSDTWQGHSKGAPFNNFPLELGKGYFVRSTAESDWQRDGWWPVTSVPIELNPIWTLIGLPKLPGPMVASDLLGEANAQGGACTQVARLENTLSDWQIHTPSVPSSDFALANDEGYFVQCANAITYTPGTGMSTTKPSAWPAPVELEALAPVADPVISDIQVTNRRDVALSITWRSDQPSTGWVEYGEKAALGQTAHDDLGEGTVSQVHHVTLTGLSPETPYYYRVHSGETVDDNRGALYKITTKKTGMPPVPYLAYGQVETADGQPAAGALVRVWLVDGGHAPSGGEGEMSSEPLSTLVDSYGYWSMSLPVDRCKDLEVKLQAVGLQGSEAELRQSACEVKPVPTATLSEEGSLKIYLPLVER